MKSTNISNLIFRSSAVPVDCAFPILVCQIYYRRNINYIFDVICSLAAYFVRSRMGSLVFASGVDFFLLEHTGRYRSRSISGLVDKGETVPLPTTSP